MVERTLKQAIIGINRRPVRKICDVLFLAFTKGEETRKAGI